MPYYRIASVVLLITGLSHLLGHTLLVPQFQLIPNFSAQIPANDTEQQLLSLDPCVP